MAPTLIRAESRLYLPGPARDGESGAGISRHEADRAVAQLRDDYERWFRLLLGMLGWVLAILGAVVALGVAETARMLSIVPHAVDLLVILVASAVAATGIAALIVLWRTGRRLVTGIQAWSFVGHRGGERPGRVGGWIRARTVNLEPRILARLITATLSLLAGVGATALFIRELGGQLTPMTSAMGVCALLALGAGSGQVGGVMRVVLALAEGDPLWNRVRPRRKRGSN